MFFFSVIKHRGTAPVLTPLVFVFFFCLFLTVNAELQDVDRKQTMDDDRAGGSTPRTRRSGGGLTHAQGPHVS